MKTIYNPGDLLILIGKRNTRLNLWNLDLEDVTVLLLPVTFLLLEEMNMQILEKQFYDGRDTMIKVLTASGVGFINSSWFQERLESQLTLLSPANHNDVL